MGRPLSLSKKGGALFGQESFRSDPRVRMVHLSDISQREEFRHISYAGMACVKTYCGLGFAGYSEALKYLVEHHKEQ